MGDERFLEIGRRGTLERIERRLERIERRLSDVESRLDGDPSR